MKRVLSCIVRTPENIEAEVESVLFINSSLFSRIEHCRHVDFCEKFSVWCLTMFNWFKSWSCMIIRFVFSSLDGPTRNCMIMSIFFFKKIIFSYESHFHIAGYVNKQNCRIWDLENSHVVLLKRQCIHYEWSYFFENEEGKNHPFRWNLFSSWWVR